MGSDPIEVNRPTLRKMKSAEFYLFMLHFRQLLCPFCVKFHRLPTYGINIVVFFSDFAESYFQKVKSMVDENKWAEFVQELVAFEVIKLKIIQIYGDFFVRIC